MRRAGSGDGMTRAGSGDGMTRAGSAAPAALAICLALGACGWIPGSGPRTGDIERGAAAGPYVLVDIDPAAARAVAGYVAEHAAEGPVALPPGRATGLTGPGDLLQVTIWEPNPDGTSLNGDKAGLQATTRIGTDGTIGVPYAGRIAAAGRTPAQIEAAIAARLAHTAPGAQVAVLVTEDVTNTVTVQGDVAKPGRYAVVPRSSGLLDMLAMAGGAATGNRQALVRVTRGDTSVTRTLTTLADTRALDADLAPGDRILVSPRRAWFSAFGAVASPGEQPYDADSITLARTLARVAGLSDNRADPAQVLVYRRQEAELTGRLAPAEPGRDPTQVIYRLDLRAPGGFFLGQQFPVLPDDLIYVSESPVSEAAKVFQVINGVSGVGAVPRNLGAPY
jgi:polysaccharide export outer membrane protein